VKKLLRQQCTTKLPGTIVWSVAKLASITFLSLALPYWIDYIGFITEGKLADVLITPSLGVPNWAVIYIINTTPSTSFLVLLPGRKKTSARGVLHAQSFNFLLFCFSLFLLASFYQKYKKISFLYSFFLCIV
jgi:hypothetical protein